MDHCIDTAQLALHEVKLTPGVEMIICIQLPEIYRKTVDLINHDGAARIYFTTDNTPAVVRGNGAYVIPATVTVAQLPLFTTDGRTTDLWLRLISEGEPVISIVRSQNLSVGSPVT